MAWEKKEQAAPQQDNLAYIDKETREAVKGNEFLTELANATLAKAEKVMDAVEKAGLTTESKKYKSEETYTDHMVVKVEPATRYDKASKEDVPLTHDDGSQIYRASAQIKHNGTTLTLIAAENPKTENFVAMNAQKWDRSNGSPKLNFYKQDDIAAAPINKEIKAVAKLVKDEGFLEKADSALKDFSVEANRYFSANSEKVLNQNSELVNNAYAKYSNDSYGEKVSLYNHTDNTVVELGATSKGDKYAVAINYDLNTDFEDRKDGEAPAKAFINNMDDLKNYVELPEVRDAIVEYKGFTEEKAKDKPKAKEHEA